MTTRKDKVVRLYRTEAIEAKPGVKRVRRAELGERGTAEADKIRDSICSVCLSVIGDAMYVEVNGEPKHYHHAVGQ